MEKWVITTFLCIVAFNILQFIILFRTWDDLPPIDGRRLLRRQYPSIVSVMNVVPMEDASILKPWPTITSFKQWTRDPDLKPFTCEAYFGNGFIDEHNFAKFRASEKASHRLEGSISADEEHDAAGSFRCFYSETLRTSICEGTKLMMDVNKITMAKGGEEIDEVVGREESEELPIFVKGAFQLRSRDMRSNEPLFDAASADRIMPKGQVGTHTMRSLLLSLETSGAGEDRCSRVVKEPTVILTRFEYANLFHTVTDWFSAYISSRVTGLASRPRLVLLDGHCKSPMDDGWKAMFSSVTYAKHFSGQVCFDHAIFAPLGYDIPLFKHITSTLGCSGCAVEDLDKATTVADKERRTARLREFGEFFVASFEGVHASKATIVDSAVGAGKQIQDVNVLFVRREDYMAHPRHTGRPESRLSNEEEVYKTLELWAVEKSTTALKVKIVNGLLAHMPLADQVRAVRNADVLVGAHGAGLTHLVFARPSTVILELSSPHYQRPHFATMSHWMGLDYRVIEMGSSAANTDEVYQMMSKILTDLK